MTLIISAIAFLCVPSSSNEHERTNDEASCARSHASLAPRLLDEKLSLERELRQSGTADRNSSLQ
jgi:hypothetical protein